MTSAPVSQRKAGGASAWRWDDFGRIVVSRFGGHSLMPRIVRYRIRRSRELADLIRSIETEMEPA